ncbi:MAG: retention module-containing protein, partial [Porticoccus sp.]|nr:retention module-containing protein [Porticoccus sp.]
MSEQETDTNMVILNESPEAIGFITSSEGAKVVVTNPDQSTRELNQGDVIRQGDILTVMDDSQVVTILDGSVRSLPKAATLYATEESFSQLVKVEGYDDYPEFEELLGLLEDGEDIAEVLEEPAAGEKGTSGDEIGQGLQFTLTGGEAIPVAGLDPNLTLPSLINATADTDQQIVVDGTTVEPSVDNSAPVANDDALSATEDTPITYTASQLLGNDFDTDGDVLVISSVTSGPGGTIVLNGDGSVTFTPDDNFSGVAEFTYTVSDGALVSTPATVFVTVNPENDPTVTNPDVNSTTEDTLLVVNEANGVLSYDSDIDDSLLV